MRKRSCRIRSIVSASLPLMVALAATPTQALGPASDVQLASELHSVAIVEDICRLTCLAETSLGADVNSLVLEADVFSVNGGVERLTLFCYGNIPDGCPNVLYFDLAEIPRNGVMSVWVSENSACNTDDLNSTVWRNVLSIGRGVDIEVQG